MNNIQDDKIEKEVKLLMRILAILFMLLMISLFVMGTASAGTISRQNQFEIPVNFSMYRLNGTDNMEITLYMSQDIYNYSFNYTMNLAEVNESAYSSEFRFNWTYSFMNYSEVAFTNLTAYNYFDNVTYMNKISENMVKNFSDMQTECNSRANSLSDQKTECEIKLKSQEYNVTESYMREQTCISNNKSLENERAIWIVSIVILAGIIIAILIMIRGKSFTSYIDNKDTPKGQSFGFG